MSVSFQNVSYTYPGTENGVSNISFDMAPGELLAVIGPSGSGKSTILNLLVGFMKPDAGRILIDGVDITDLPPRARGVGVVFQSYALFPHMTSWQNVAYPLKVRGMAVEERKARALKALEAVGLAAFAERPPRNLSGGQQQRVALARALVFEPRALLLDEPLSALDANTREDMRDEIMRVQQQAGIATLHVTHDQEEALSIAHRVAVMHSGRLLQLAAPKELYDNPVDRTVAAFVGHANLWDGTVGEGGTVMTPVGPLTCDTGGYRAGQPVTVLVRPEHVIAHADAVAAAGAANLFDGMLDHDRFLGAVRRFDLAVAGGKIRGETRNRDALTAVSIPPEHVRLLPPVV
ncbi:ABC transporter ATP-binding protein [Futiania mangrovi]|uniref:ABC transporter ATP-binding protein n=1 Tax=Futiania mangrovi TaxID=2959716 RepID=A0A9J6PM05_9PROT|nr:ABC transporter ATP-binding protein [Futiania mangrovii]MCP1337687.1 ABC transporter ATP-binding protein [Futiania mangrovii]